MDGWDKDNDDCMLSYFAHYLDFFMFLHDLPVHFTLLGLEIGVSC